MFKIGSETYFVDWFVVYSCVSLVAGVFILWMLHKVTRKSKSSIVIPLLISAIGCGVVVSFDFGIDLSKLKAFVNPPPEEIPPELCKEAHDCIVDDSCGQVKAINKKFLRDNSSNINGFGICSVIPKSRRAVYRTECIFHKCGFVLVKPSTYQEVLDRLEGQGEDSRDYMNSVRTEFADVPEFVKSLCPRNEENDSRLDEYAKRWRGHFDNICAYRDDSWYLVCGNPNSKGIRRVLRAKRDNDMWKVKELPKTVTDSYSNSSSCPMLKYLVDIEDI